MFALILPGAVAVFSLILLINFFRSIPKELEEAALIDGAGQFRTLFAIYIPLSMPSIATFSLFSMVYHWNSWFDGLLYMTDYRKYPLSSFLQTIVVAKDFTKVNMNVSDLKTISERRVTDSLSARAARSASVKKGVFRQDDVDQQDSVTGVE